jgi:uncharacterized membrane protein
VRIRPDKLWFMIFVIILLGYTAFFALNQINMQATFRNVGGHDVGQLNQFLWNMIHGRAPVTTIGLKSGFEDGSQRLSIFRNHLFIIHLLLVPIYYLFPSYNTLFIVYTLSFSTSAVILYLIARRETGENFFAFVLASSYILSPTIWRSFYCGFRPLPLAIPFLLLCYYFIKKHNVKVYFIFLFLALFCKENIAVFTFFLGAYIFVGKNIIPRNKLWGSVIMALSVLYFFTVANLIIPLFSETGDYRHLEGISVHKAGSYLRDFIVHNKGIGILKIAAPVAFMPFFSPVIILLVPGILTIFFFTFLWNVWQNSIFVSFVYLAAAIEAGAINRRSRGLLRVITIFMMVSTFYFNALPLKKLEVFNLSEGHGLVSDLKDRYIPAESSVLTQTQLIPPFSNRDEVNHLDFGRLLAPSDWEDLDADYLFIGCQRAYCEFELDEILALRDLLEMVRKYKVIAAEGGYLVLKNGMPADLDDREYRERGLQWLEQTLEQYLRSYRELADHYPDVARAKGYFRNLERIRARDENYENPQAKNNNNI